MRILKIVLLNFILMSFGLSGCASTNTTANEITAVKYGKAKSQEKRNLEMLTCWEVLTLSEEDSNFAMVLLYGYHAGKSNQPIQPAEKIARIILDAVKICDKNPDKTVLETIQSLDK